MQEQDSSDGAQPPVRPGGKAGVPARGIRLPADTLFRPTLHHTTTAAVTLYEDIPVPAHAEDIARARAWLAEAGAPRTCAAVTSRHRDPLPSVLTFAAGRHRIEVELSSV